MSVFNDEYGWHLLLYELLQQSINNHDDYYTSNEHDYYFTIKELGINPSFFNMDRSSSFVCCF